MHLDNLGHAAFLARLVHLLGMLCAQEFPSFAHSEFHKLVHTLLVDAQCPSVGHSWELQVLTVKNAKNKRCKYIYTVYRVLNATLKDCDFPND